MGRPRHPRSCRCRPDPGTSHVADHSPRSRGRRVCRSCCRHCRWRCCPISSGRLVPDQPLTRKPEALTEVSMPVPRAPRSRHPRDFFPSLISYPVRSLSGGMSRTYVFDSTTLRWKHKAGHRTTQQRSCTPPSLPKRQPVGSDAVRRFRGMGTLRTKWSRRACEHVNADRQDQETDDTLEDVLGNVSQETSTGQRASEDAHRANHDLRPVL